MAAHCEGSPVKYLYDRVAAVGGVYLMCHESAVSKRVRRIRLGGYKNFLVFGISLWEHILFFSTPQSHAGSTFVGGRSGPSFNRCRAY